MRLLLIGHGYVGSYLLPVLQGEGHRVDVCDENSAVLNGLPNALCWRYQRLAVNQLRAYDGILWFAGHSSVPKAIADPDGAVANNCLDLLSFARMRRPHVRLIYASTSSVYSMPQQGAFAGPPPELAEDMTLLNPLNAYDCSKISFDALARCFTENVVGLRLGTVCGSSPNLRGELIFNAMNISAIDHGVVRVANGAAMRNILFLDDLAAYVCRLLRIAEPLPQILNVGSLNVSIGQLAEEIAAHYGVPVVKGPDAPTYSFRMDCSRIARLAGAPRMATLSERCFEFSRHYRERKWRAAS